MRTIGLISFCLFCIISCENDASKDCVVSERFKNTLADFLHKHNTSIEELDLECIEDFPDIFDNDSTKTGFRTIAELDEGTVILEEYHFSWDFLDKSAARVTYVEFIADHSDEWAYSHIGCDDGNCLVIKVKSSKVAEKLEDELDDLKSKYVHYKTTN